MEDCSIRDAALRLKEWLGAAPEHFIVPRTSGELIAYAGRAIDRNIGFQPASASRSLSSTCIERSPRRRARSSGAKDSSTQSQSIRPAVRRSWRLWARRSHGVRPTCSPVISISHPWMLVGAAATQLRSATRWELGHSVSPRRSVGRSTSSSSSTSRGCRRCHMSIRRITTHIVAVMRNRTRVPVAVLSATYSSHASV